MPVVTIQALPISDAAQIQSLLADVSSELTAALSTVPSNVWVNFTPMAAVREGDSTGHKADYHPIVTVLANPRPTESVQLGLQAVAKAVAAGLKVKLESVWVHWVDLLPGRVFGDGKVK